MSRSISSEYAEPFYDTGGVSMTSDECLADLRAFIENNQVGEFVTRSMYRAGGNASDRDFVSHFGSWSTFKEKAIAGISARKALHKAPFEVKPLPPELPSIDELLERRRKEFERVDAAKKARRLVDVSIKLDGPIGIAHGGDPHIDDKGCNVPLIERHVQVIQSTPGLFAANLGDYRNGWVGRLARLYAEQSTSDDESWALAEWYVRSMNFLYLISGNHDTWQGAGDPLKWITRNAQGISEPGQARMNLCFPNGRQVRVNARHSFKGNSQWNTAHGVAKAAQMGWRDHILVAGHTHVSGYNILKDPATGLISHALQVASYKTHDRYAEQLGLPDSNISECVTTIVDPYATQERCLVTVFMDLEEAAEFLTWKRSKFAQNKRVNV